MTKYKVNVEYLYSKIIEVDAIDDENAHNLVDAMIQDGSLSMNEDNFQQYEIFVQDTEDNSSSVSVFDEEIS